MRNSLALNSTQQTQKIYYALRIACAMCFIGHGAFGIITKPIWCNYFGVFGIGQTTSYSLMPWVGSVDILFGLLLLFYPVRAVAAWLVLWGFFTAMLRPLSGEPFAEWIERAGNYGAPLTLLLFTYNKESVNQLLKPILVPSTINKENIQRATWCLRIVVFLFLIGHGWLNIIEKASIIDQYKALGFTKPVTAAHVVGSLEILVALSVLVRPIASVLFILFIWKIISELFYPHWELFEWIERGGSYGTILALWFITRNNTVTILSFRKIKQHTLLSLAE